MSGAFSQAMRVTATNLIKELGNMCVLTEPVTAPKVYDPHTGQYASQALPPVKYPIHSAQSRKASVLFSQDGTNTNLTGFEDSSYIVAWFGKKVTTEWLYDGQNIQMVTPITSQDDIIAFNESILPESRIPNDVVLEFIATQVLINRRKTLQTALRIQYPTGVDKPKIDILIGNLDTATIVKDKPKK